MAIGLGIGATKLEGIRLVDQRNNRCQIIRILYNRSLVVSHPAREKLWWVCELAVAIAWSSLHVVHGFPD
jgi:hypothetical protein